MNYNDAKIAMRVLNLDGGEGSGVKGHTTEHDREKYRPAISKQGDRRVAANKEGVDRLSFHHERALEHATQVEFAPKGQAARHLQAAELHFAAAKELRAFDHNGALAKLNTYMVQARKAAAG
jgi:hypothetical protein